MSSLTFLMKQSNQLKEGEQVPKNDKQAKAGVVPKRRRFFLISAISDQAILSFTSTTASHASADCKHLILDRPRASSCCCSTRTMRSCTYRWNGSTWSSDTRVLKDTNRN